MMKPDNAAKFDVEATDNACRRPRKKASAPLLLRGSA
jgi:hypothetical protein